MEQRNKRRALVVVGAGASVEYGIPVTSDFGKIIEATVRNDEYCQRIGGTDAYLDVAGKLLAYYGNPGEAHFERIYHVLHELDALHVTPGAVAKFKPVMAPFLEATQSYEPLALRAAARTMIDCIYGEVSAVCQAPKKPLEPLARFFAGLEEMAYLPRVYSTNYDDFVGQATNDRYFTGFTQSRGDYADFDATVFWSHWDVPALFHMHGSIHMGFPHPDAQHEIGDIAWYPVREDALKYATFTGSGDARMDGTQISRSAIITGLDKLGRLQRTPYTFYYSALSRDAMEADVIFVLGSGLADLHLNTWLKAVRRAKPNVPILYVGYWNGDTDDLYSTIHFDYRDREISLIHDLRIKLNDLPGSALKALSGWTVDATKTAAVWTDGFQSFLNEPQALRDAMQAIGA
ncbi:SIR2 family protein [Paraburkholderia mimosarum]|uniref:SIR2 family protein n=1 Tax=Paraburkholderia mimosarum TaxID=312026 RepID=UPI00041DFC5C|nr:SIR2 family protein [Paraburkholderia mimosarum]